MRKQVKNTNKETEHVTKIAHNKAQETACVSSANECESMASFSFSYNSHLSRLFDAVDSISMHFLDCKKSQ